MKSIIVVLFLCFIPITSLAQERPVLDYLIDDITYKLKLDDLDMRKEIIDGKEYGCFGKKETGLLLQLRLDFPKLVEKNRKQDNLIKIKDEKLLLMSKMNLNLKDQSAFIMKENTSLRLQLDERDAWYRSPFLWFCVGIVVGSGTTILIVSLVN